MWAMTLRPLCLATGHVTPVAIKEHESPEAFAPRWGSNKNAIIKSLILILLFPTMI